MENQILFFAFAISAFLLAIVAAGVVSFVIGAVIFHFFPNCAFSKWIADEVFQEEHLNGYGEIKSGVCLKPKGK